MENIYSILEKKGIVVPEEKKADLEKSLLANYKTVSELENLKTKYDNAIAERDNIKLNMKLIFHLVTMIWQHSRSSWQSREQTRVH
jgi:hypothetical protein